MINAYYFYKISHELYKLKIPVLPKLFKLFCFMIYNCSIPYQCKIGKHSKFGYGGIGVVLHKRAEIGNRCIIGTNVTIGGKSGEINVPKIGDNVYIATGAKILGDVKVGNNAIIGANAVVLKDVPENAVVGGIPAKILSFKNE